MADMEPFTLIERTARPGPHHLFDDVVRLTSAKTADHDLQYIAALREANPEMIVTAVPASNVSFRAFAAAGYATCELDTTTDSFASWRGYVSPRKRSDPGLLGESIDFAKYHYVWAGEHFILFCVSGYYQYVLKERRDDEDILGPSKVTDKLIKATGDWLSSLSKVVWVYDDYWTRSEELWKQVQKSSWVRILMVELFTCNSITGAAIVQTAICSSRLSRRRNVEWLQEIDVTLLQAENADAAISHPSICLTLVLKFETSADSFALSSLGRRDPRRVSEERAHRCDQKVLHVERDLRRARRAVEARALIPWPAREWKDHLD